MLHRIAKPLLGKDYPEVEFTEGSTLHVKTGLIPDYLGLGDAKRFYDRWRAHINPNGIRIETIKLMRYMYSWGFYMACETSQNVPLPKTSDPKKTYTAKEMQNAYIQGVKRGMAAFDAALSTALDENMSQLEKAHKEMVRTFRERANSESELVKDADELAKECDCPRCRAEQNNPPDMSDPIEFMQQFGIVGANGEIEGNGGIVDL